MYWNMVKISTEPINPKSKKNNKNYHLDIFHSDYVAKRIKRREISEFTNDYQYLDHISKKQN